MHYFSNLFWNGTLHVLVRLTVHHQESSTVHTAIGICHTGYAGCLLARSGWNSLPACIFQLWPVTRQAKAGRYNQHNDTRWLEAVCAESGGSWWWAQECPKHVERNKNTINFNDFKTIVNLVGFLFIVVIADARNHEPERLLYMFWLSLSPIFRNTKQP
jgi:hypothetical protein